MHFHLTQQQRIELSLLTRLGHSQRTIALLIGVNASTICRELSRNSRTGHSYHAAVARTQVVARRLRANQRLRKLLGNADLELLVASKLAVRWSPEQIAG